MATKKPYTGPTVFCSSMHEHSTGASPVWTFTGVGGSFYSCASEACMQEAEEKADDASRIAKSEDLKRHPTAARGL